MREILLKWSLRPRVRAFQFNFCCFYFLFCRTIVYTFRVRLAILFFYNRARLVQCQNSDMSTQKWNETGCSVSGDTLQYSLEESVYHRRTLHVTQLFTYLLTHKLFSSCIRQYLVSRACDWVMPVLYVVLPTSSFQFNLLFFNISLTMPHQSHI